MATAVFQGASADWDDTSNWTGGGGAGGVPANGDTIIIGQSSQDLTTNLVTGLNTITLRIGPGYSGQIGTSTDYLDIDGGIFDLDGGSPGGVYLTGVWTTINVHGGLASSAMLDLKANATTDIGTLRILGGTGTVTVGAGAVLDDLIVASAPSITVTVGAVTSLDNVTVESGAVSVAGNIATKADVRGGVLTIDGSATVAQLDIEPGGTCIYDTSGALTTMNGYGGFFDGRQNTNASITLTTVTLYEGHTMDLRSGLMNYTLTNGVVTRGGIFYPPIGSTLKPT